MESLQSSPEIVGADEVGEMTAELVVVVVVIPLDGRFLDGSVHALDLAVRPGVLWFGCAINGHEEREPALCRLHLGNIDVKATDRVSLELLLRGQVALDFRKPGYAVTLKTSMQGRPAQMRNCRLKRIKTVVERKQSVPAKGDNDRLFFDRKHR